MESRDAIVIWAFAAVSSSVSRSGDFEVNGRLGLGNASIGVALISALILLGTTSCAVLPSESPGGPSPDAPPSSVDQLTPDETAALTALEAHEKNTFYLFTAQGLIMQQCLAARGIVAYPASLVTDPLRELAGVIDTPEAYAMWYAAGRTPNSVSVTPTNGLAAYGYSGAAQLNQPVDPIEADYRGMTPAEQDAVQIAIDGRNGDLAQVVPVEESCKGEVNATLFVDPEGDGKKHSQESLIVVGELIDSIPSAETQVEIRKDLALQEAGKEWSDCMTSHGFYVSGMPSAAPQDPSEIDQVELDSEVTLATTGAECEAQTQLNAVYQTAVKNWRISKVRGNATQILEYFEVRGPFIAAAKKYLGVG